MVIVGSPCPTGHWDWGMAVRAGLFRPLEREEEGEEIERPDARVASLSLLQGCVFSHLDKGILQIGVVQVHPAQLPHHLDKDLRLHRR